MDIRFGTDGWRGVIADDFTVSRVRQVALALAEHVKSHEIPGSIIVGFDRRFGSERFARAAAEVLAGEGLPILFSARFTPTPAISWAVKQRVAAAGLVVTASHNPAAYNGIKIKESFGGSARTELTHDLEVRARRIVGEGIEPLAPVFDDCIREGQIELFDPIEPYVARLGEMVDLNRVGSLKFPVLVDPMHGAGAGVLLRILRDAGLEATEIRGTENPSFGGVSPEPIRSNLGSLIASMKREGQKIGIALDGDADRIGVVDERCRFFDSHRIFACVLRHLVEHRNLPGAIARTVSSTVMIERLADRYGRKLVETPIGFKWIAEKMLEGGVLMGGEESGGFGYSMHLPERDGSLTALLLLEACAVEKLTPARLLQQVFAEVGVWHYDRIDIQLPAERGRELWKVVRDSLPSELAGRRIVGTNERDGLKLLCEGGAWLLLRPSGTEPVLRIYAEAETENDVKTLLTTGRQLAGV